MAETTTLQSPRPTRKQIWAVFGADPDFARKVEKIFDDLVNAANALNANAAELEEARMDVDSARAMAVAAMGLVVKASETAEALALVSGQINRLNARLTHVERLISDIQQAPL